MQCLSDGDAKLAACVFIVLNLSALLHVSRFLHVARHQLSSTSHPPTKKTVAEDGQPRAEALISPAVLKAWLQLIEVFKKKKKKKLLP